MKSWVLIKLTADDVLSTVEDNRLEFKSNVKAIEVLYRLLKDSVPNAFVPDRDCWPIMWCGISFWYVYKVKISQMVAYQLRTIGLSAKHVNQMSEPAVLFSHCKDVSFSRIKRTCLTSHDALKVCWRSCSKSLGKKSSWYSEYSITVKWWPDQNFPIIAMLLLTFYRICVTSARKSEKTFNHEFNLNDVTPRRSPIQ